MTRREFREKCLSAPQAERAARTEAPPAVDVQLVGEVAADLRHIRLPDVYKGKGIRYQGEVVKLKPGKAGKTGKGAK